MLKIENLKVTIENYAALKSFLSPLTSHLTPKNSSPHNLITS